MTSGSARTISSQAMGLRRFSAPTCTAEAPAIIISMDVFGAGDASAAHYRYAAGLVHLIDHSEGYREYRPSGEASGLRGDDGPSAAYVYAHAEEGVDERQPVRSGILACPGNRHDIGHVGAELYEHGLAGAGLLRGGGHLCCGRRVGAERHASVVHVGAGDVHLHDVYPAAPGRPAAAVGVFLYAEAAYVGDYGAVVHFPQCRDLLSCEDFDAGVLQSHGVYHALAAFCDARRGIAEACLARRALEADSPEAAEVYRVREFQAKPKVPLAGMTGFTSRILHRFTERSFTAISSRSF